MLDVGSTTTDVIPVAAAAWRPAVAPTSTGCWRASSSTPACCAPTSRRSLRACPVRGRLCPVASELFAISADVHLILGHLPPGAYTRPTPDGRPASVEYARERVARLVCADAGAARARRGRRDRRVPPRGAGAPGRGGGAAGERRASRRAPPVVPLGAGAFLAREVAERLGRRGAGAAVERGRARGGARGRARRAAAARVRGRDDPGRTPARRADRRQGRRRARARGRRRRAAGAVRGDRGRSARAIRCSSCPAAGISRTPSARTTAASACGRRARTGWRSSPWTSSAGCSPT